LTAFFWGGFVEFQVRRSLGSEPRAEAFCGERWARLALLNKTIFKVAAQAAGFRQFIELY